MSWVISSNSDQLVYSKPAVARAFEKNPCPISIICRHTRAVKCNFPFWIQQFPHFLLNLLNFGFFFGQKVLSKNIPYKKNCIDFSIVENHTNRFSPKQTERNLQVCVVGLFETIWGTILSTPSISRRSRFEYMEILGKKSMEENHQKWTLKHHLGFGFFTWSSIKIRLLFFFLGKNLELFRTVCWCWNAQHLVVVLMDWDSGLQSTRSIKSKRWMGKNLVFLFCCHLDLVKQNGGFGLVQRLVVKKWLKQWVISVFVLC